jgi:hypothetical protein
MRKQEPSTPEDAMPGLAVDLSAKKSDFISRIVFLAGDLLTLAHRCDEASAQFFANQFNGGAANEISQNDIVGANTHLTVADVTSVITAAQAVSTALSSGARDNLRKVLGTPDF